MKFSIRDLLWLIVAVAVLMAWVVDRQSLAVRRKRHRNHPPGVSFEYSLRFSARNIPELDLAILFKALGYNEFGSKLLRSV